MCINALELIFHILGIASPFQSVHSKSLLIFIVISRPSSSYSIINQSSSYISPAHSQDLISCLLLPSIIPKRNGSSLHWRSLISTHQSTTTHSTSCDAVVESVLSSIVGRLGFSFSRRGWLLDNSTEAVAHILMGP